MNTQNDPKRGIARLSLGTIVALGVGILLVAILATVILTNWSAWSTFCLCQFPTE